MRLIVLGSGSKGNSTYIETEYSKILIDSGLSLRDTEARLDLIGVNPNELDGVIITHEHGDHIKSVGTLSRKYNLNVFAHQEIWDALLKRAGHIALPNQKQITNEMFAINDIDFVPFDVPHDAIHCLGYSVYNKDNKITFATDLGYVTDEILNALYKSDLAILESNYDPELMRKSRKYPEYLKQRITSERGHLSNPASAEVLRKLLHQNVRGVVLAHISEETNTPELAFNSALDILTAEGAELHKDIHVAVAPQHNVGSMYKLKNRNTN